MIKRIKTNTPNILQTSRPQTTTVNSYIGLIGTCKKPTGSYRPDHVCVVVAAAAAAAAAVVVVVVVVAVLVVLIGGGGGGCQVAAVVVIVIAVVGMTQ